MRKAYVIIKTGVFNFVEIPTEVIGVFTNYALAKNTFDKIVVQEEEIDRRNKYDCFEKTKENYSGYIDGEYIRCHTNISLTGCDLDRIYYQGVKND